MLVFSRKTGETIILADTIVVSVIAVEGKRVKIGIRAPLDVHIVREELLRREPAEPPDLALPTPSMGIATP